MVNVNLTDTSIEVIVQNLTRFLDNLSPKQKFILSVFGFACPTGCGIYKEYNKIKQERLKYYNANTSTD